MCARWECSSRGWWLYSDILNMEQEFKPITVYPESISSKPFPALYFAVQALHSVSHTGVGVLVLSSFKFPYILYLLEYLYMILEYLTSKVLFMSCSPSFLLKNLFMCMIFYQHNECTICILLPREYRRSCQIPWMWGYGT